MTAERWAGFGVRVEVRGIEHLPEGTGLEDFLPPGFAPTEEAPAVVCRIRPTDGGLTLFEGSSVASAPGGRAEIWNGLAMRLAARAAEEMLVLHAGVVGWDTSAVVLPGLSGDGKTTQVAAFLESGAAYFSDELAPIRGDIVFPWTKPLSVKSHPVLKPGLICPEELACSIATEAVPIGAIAVVAYDPDLPEALEVERLGVADAVLELLRHTLGPRTPALLERIEEVCRGVPVYRGRRSEADEALVAIRGLVQVT